jgi:ribose transport system substrate-binding protein
MKRAILLGGVIIALSVPAFAKDLNSVGLTLGNLSNPFFVHLAKGAEAKAKELSNGKAELTVVAADYDLNRQYMQIDNFISSGVDLVLVNAASSNAMEASLKRLHDAGIVSVAVDVTASGSDATVMTDNVQAGRDACQYIADKLQGGGNVIIIDGPPVSSVVDRIQGCKGVFASHPDIKILSESQQGRAIGPGGYNVVANLLNTFPKIDAIFTTNDPEAIDTDLAAKQLGRRDFFITSVDGSPAVADALKRNDELRKSFAVTGFRERRSSSRK